MSDIHQVSQNQSSIEQIHQKTAETAPKGSNKTNFIAKNAFKSLARAFQRENLLSNLTIYLMSPRAVLAKASEKIVQVVNRYIDIEAQIKEPPVNLKNALNYTRQKISNFSDALDLFESNPKQESFLTQNVDVATHFNQEPLGKGGGSVIYHASVNVEGSNEPLLAISCVGNSEINEQNPFDPEKLSQNIQHLEKLVGPNVATVYKVSTATVEKKNRMDVRTETGEKKTVTVMEKEKRSQIVMEKLNDLTKASASERKKCGENFLNAFLKMDKADFVHTDLNVNNLMFREGDPTTPVMIDLDDVRTIASFTEGVKDGASLANALWDYDWKTDEFNPPGFGDRVIALRKKADALGNQMTKTQLKEIKNEFSQLIKEKERFNAACTLYQLSFCEPVELTPGKVMIAPHPIKKAEGRMGKEPNMDQIKDQLSSAEDISPQVRKFMTKVFKPYH